MTQPKVLVVDDEPFICRSLTFVLKKGNYDVLEARDGQEALSAIREHKPDLVFLDVMMPKMSGFEVCETIKKEHGLDSVHIVLLTAKGQEADREKGYALGADNYITKPFDPDTLFDYACERLGLDL